MDIFAHTTSPSFPACSGLSTTMIPFRTATITPPPCRDRGLCIELSKFFGRISEGLYVELKVLLSASDGSFVSEMIRMSSWVLCISSASSALLPLMLLAFSVPIRRLFRLAGDDERSWALGELVWVELALE